MASIKPGPWGALPDVTDSPVCTGMLVVRGGEGPPVGTTLPAAPVAQPKGGGARAARRAPVNRSKDISGKRYLDEFEVEAIYGISHRTLQDWRMLGTGPRYRKFGTRVKYQVVALEEWIEQQPEGGDGVEASAIKRGRRGWPRRDARL
jgi:hypothetical protein